MRLYRLNFYDSHRGCLVSWHPSLRAAEREFARLKRKRQDDVSGPEGIHVVDVPTNKVGLLAWLNAHFDTDNG
jgi:hypothetical protein